MGDAHDWHHPGCVGGKHVLGGQSRQRSIRGVLWSRDVDQRLRTGGFDTAAAGSTQLVRHRIFGCRLRILSGLRLGEYGEGMSKNDTSLHTKSTSGFYFLGFLGAAIYFISHANGFWDGVLGFLKALVWPAFLVYEAFAALLG